MYAYALINKRKIVSYDIQFVNDLFVLNWEERGEYREVTFCYNEKTTFLHAKFSPTHFDSMQFYYNGVPRVLDLLVKKGVITSEFGTLVRGNTGVSVVFEHPVHLDVTLKVAGYQVGKRQLKGGICVDFPTEDIVKTLFQVA